MNTGITYNSSEYLSDRPFEDAASQDAAFFSTAESGNVVRSTAADTAQDALANVAQDTLTDTAPLHFRPHHLLCLQTFVGKGYSDEFVSQMALVKEHLERDPLAHIAIVSGADDLCRHCPNCEDGQCTSVKPARFDSLVLDKLRALSDAGCLGPQMSPDSYLGQQVSHDSYLGQQVSHDSYLGQQVSHDSYLGQQIVPSGFLLCGIPAGLRITHSLLEECCPECEWKELCREIVRARYVF